ncbi:alpha/beta fold hydrolase [[Mycoplasma] testudinis]|uniref:alpha/beta fold hydrolase n=1 Tax=[Mycoplasma] testudinis TaxID=33924 RepID=UPI00146FC2F2|nr:alpha/beta fold hydrolase [[Mycoplasma] testudinis]
MNIQNIAGYLPVDNNAQIYYEVRGNPAGIPVVFLHGGPGGEFNEQSFQYFDLNVYKVIAFEQRGCGRSVPQFSLINNTTQYLASDIEKLRIHLRINNMVGIWRKLGHNFGFIL